MLTFPRNFLWGAATSAHQVEGDNLKNDWWDYEERGKLKEPSGKACRHYELYEEDFGLAKELNHNCHRFSIEWSRIEPEEGKFQASEIEHYRKVILSLKERGIEPIVTLHHFTSPVWFMAKGGWVNHHQQKYFLRFVERIVNEFAKEVKYWITINEPTVYVFHSYISGSWPPQEKSFFKARNVFDNFASSHIKAYRIIHRIYKEKKLRPPLVSISANLQAFEYCRPTLLNKIAVFLRNKYSNFYFIDKLMTARSLDYIGVNYYGRNLVDAKSLSFSGIFFATCQDNHLPLKRNSLGWDIYPLGLYKLLIKLKKYKLPIVITENGICTDDDSLRWEYIITHLESVARAIADGVNVLGYIYWALLDNFEWAQGFFPRFGLIHVDYQNYRRSIRESGRKFSQIIKESKNSDGRTN